MASSPIHQRQALNDLPFEIYRCIAAKMELSDFKAFLGSHRKASLLRQDVGTVAAVYLHTYGSSALFNAYWNACNHDRLVEVLLGRTDQGPDYLEWILVAAIERGQVRLVRRLLGMTDPTNALFKHLLELACRYERIEVLTVLIDAAPADMITTEMWRMLMRVAIESRRIETMTLIFRKTSTSWTERAKDEAFETAWGHGHDKCVTRLFLFGFEPSLAAVEEGLKLAAESGHAITVRWLLNRALVRPRRHAPKSDWPDLPAPMPEAIADAFMRAVSNNHASVISEFMDARIDSEVINGALVECIEHARADVVETMLQCGFAPNWDTLDTSRVVISTPASQAIMDRLLAVANRSTTSSMTTLASNDSIQTTEA